MTHMMKCIMARKCRHAGVSVVDSVSALHSYSVGNSSIFIFEFFFVLNIRTCFQTLKEGGGNLVPNGVCCIIDNIDD